MSENYTLSEELKELAEEVINEREDLKHIIESGVRIGYMTSNKKKKSHGMIVQGDCEKVKPKNMKFIPFDFIITFYEPHVQFLDADKMRLLMYHELLHVGAERSEAGELRTWVRPHNIQDFREIVDVHGLDWSEPND